MYSQCFHKLKHRRIRFQTSITLFISSWYTIQPGLIAARSRQPCTTDCIPRAAISRPTAEAFICSIKSLSRLGISELTNDRSEVYLNRSRRQSVGIDESADLYNGPAGNNARELEALSAASFPPVAPSIKWAFLLAGASRNYIIGYNGRHDLLETLSVRFFLKESRVTSMPIHFRIRYRHSVLDLGVFFHFLHLWVNGGLLLGQNGLRNAIPFRAIFGYNSKLNNQTEN